MKKLIKNIIFLIIVMLMLNGCASENKIDTQLDTSYAIVDNEKTEEASDKNESEPVGSITEHWEYTGYEDEWKWTGEDADEFTDQDYDNDGIYDRVYREQKEDTEFCHYRIEFGNGTVIDMDKNVYSTGFPHVKSGDINGDGENEIIFSLTYDTSTDMRLFGDLVVYEKQGDSYKETILPFEKTDVGYGQEVPVHYELVRNGLIKVSVNDGGYETLVPVSTYLWEEASYENFNDVAQDHAVWENYLLEQEGQTWLVCKIHLFDKWSSNGLYAVLACKDGEYVVDRWLRVSDEFDDTICEDSLWTLEDYRLCCQEIETDSGKVRVELWLSKGEYCSAEELIPGGGVYEENYMGEYYLQVTDFEGNILSKRELTQDFPDIDRLNFPGTFELIFEDYNQDSCPDFTIGYYGSSSVNLYALYTIRSDGEISLIGRDIPNCSPGEFSIAFESSDDRTIYGSIWDNSVGEIRNIVYSWDEGKQEYIEASN